MEYEITITALSANGETPLNRGKLWKVKTEGGKYSQNQQQGPQLMLLAFCVKDD